MALAEVSERAYKAFAEYIALKQCFSSDYDYAKYGGRTSVKRSSLNKRPDRFQFEKLGRHKDVKGFLLANLVENPSIWVGALHDHMSEKRYREWLRRQQSLSYRFQADLNLLHEQSLKFDDVILCENGQHPLILRQYLAGRVSPETITIVTELTRCGRYWNHKLDMDPVWRDVKYRVLKYHGFLKFDVSDFNRAVVVTFMAGPEEESL